MLSNREEVHELLSVSSLCEDTHTILSLWRRAWPNCSRRSCRPQSGCVAPLASIHTQRELP